MSFAVLAILLPLLAAPVLALVGQPVAGARAHLALTLLTFALTWAVPAAPGLGVVRADGAGIVFGVLAGLVAVLFAVTNLGAARQVADGARRWRARHACGQAVLGLTLLGFYADSAVLLWLAVAGLGLAAALIAVLEGGAAVAGTVLRVAGAAALLALFGTLLVDLAARPALGAAALSFVALGQDAGLAGPPLALGFVLLAFGYGLAVGVGWLPAVLGVGSPLAGLLGLLSPNLALLAVLRFRHLAGTQGGAPPLLAGLGLAALLLAAVAVRRRPRWRLLGLVGIAQAGVVAVAFGLGGAAAVFGGLLTMLLQTLAQAGAWQAPAEQGKAAGWPFGVAAFALTGLPPGGLFVGQYLVVSDVARQAAWLLPALLLGWLPVALALLRTARWMTASPADAAPAGAVAAGTVALPLLLTVGLGYAMPSALVALLSAAAVALR